MTDSYTTTVHRETSLSVTDCPLTFRAYWQQDTFVCAKLLEVVFYNGFSVPAAWLNTHIPLHTYFVFSVPHWFNFYEVRYELGRIFFLQIRSDYILSSTELPCEIGFSYILPLFTYLEVRIVSAWVPFTYSFTVPASISVAFSSYSALILALASASIFGFI
jgi:hypothetical protein